MKTASEFLNQGEGPFYLAATSGLLVILSFPKFGSGITAWVALVPLFYALREPSSLKRAATLGFLTGIIFNVGIIYWLSIAVVQYGYLPIWLGIGAMLFVAAYLAIYVAVFSAGIVFLRRYGIPAFVCAAPLWVCLDYFRANYLHRLSLGGSGLLPVQQFAPDPVCRYRGCLFTYVCNCADKQHYLRDHTKPPKFQESGCGDRLRGIGYGKYVRIRFSEARRNPSSDC